MPTLAQVQTTIDGLIDQHLPKIAAKQENFRGNRGRYWMGDFTHSSLPNHGNKWDNRVADRLAVIVGDEAENWRNTLPDIDGLALPCGFRVDNYSGPDGRGWVLWVGFKYEGAIWARAVNVGPETWRNLAWHVSEAFN